MSIWIEDFFILHSRASGNITIAEVQKYCEVIGEEDVDFFMRVIFDAERRVNKALKEDKDFSDSLKKKP